MGDGVAWFDVEYDGGFVTTDMQLFGGVKNQATGQDHLSQVLRIRSRDGLRRTAVMWYWK
ncbi:hypothetical protein HDU76_001994 [Blyttiomyces sp. JEL0837]|nr:hypothetical protein HDU76_001994 [Blyttiomyces sp. JEL0837]